MKLIPLKLLSGIFCLILLASCASGTAHIAPVRDFEMNKYTGIWYEMARLPNDFEENLSNVSASYTLRSNGYIINVLNKGYDVKKREWIEKSAYAFPRSESDIGELSVVFHWPLRAKYKIIFLDVNYRYAIVTGSTMSYLWILSRSPMMRQGVFPELVEKARSWGYNTENLIIVNQDMNIMDYYNRDDIELPSEIQSRLFFE
ncbi:MAG: hypothetical protein A2017_12880 [Lentisphaerae bacterium GWF2_44_16]|nr:MAG: hypothetical protein A2017_12880 [Lentisphaerae bacterium GWF2_44_16]